MVSQREVIGSSRGKARDLLQHIVGDLLKQKQGGRTTTGPGEASVGHTTPGLQEHIPIPVVLLRNEYFCSILADII